MISLSIPHLILGALIGLYSLRSILNLILAIEGKPYTPKIKTRWEMASVAFISALLAFGLSYVWGQL
jgi:hypothetical protein